MKLNWSILFAVVILSAVVPVHAKSDRCGLRRYFVDLDSKVSTSYFLAGAFSLSANDDEDATRMFHDEESGVNVSVGVQKYASAITGSPKKIRLIISFTGKSDESFETLEGPAAESVYDKNWKWLAVSNDIKVGNRVYTYSFACERELKRVVK